MKPIAWFLCLPLAMPWAAHAAELSYAQQLIDTTLASRPEVSGISMHVTRPKTTDNVVVASSLNDTSSVNLADDLAVIQSGDTRAKVEDGHVDVRLPLLDMSRRPLGSLEVVVPGADVAKAEKAAVSVRDAVARRISHINNLLEPARFDQTTPLNSYAQHLVDVALAQHPKVVILAIHATPPNTPDDVIVGSNIGRIGKKADEDDLNVIKTGVPKLEFNETGDRYEVELPLHDLSGDTLGAVGVVFNYKKGDDTKAHQAEAIAIRDAMARRISNPANLVEPWPFDPKVPSDTRAQKLVDRTLAAHHELIILAIHVTPPGAAHNLILASNIGRIGKEADDDDMRVANTGAVNQEVNSTGKRFEVELPLLDAKGARIGALSCVFRYNKGADKKALYNKAIVIRDAMRPQIGSVAALAAPAR
ncbi:hypothetical protein [Phenylobacterium montanum]|uniref:Flagellar assembly protein T N-terminal domain-containing protein n=1 Tax=Phenylobacterium montanum TaxID=2823693 RepID=A0A975G2Y9_9CAUL|nr:hypothetical protein [Caulobacter sp. S6]QUD89602.1 hypothetical protein KCG34_06895 [Caulobacter sp. S6]